MRRLLRSAWGFTVALIAVALTLVGIVDTLHDETDERRQSQIMVGEMESDAAELQAAEDAVMATRGGAEPLAEVADELEDLQEKFGELAAAADDPVLAPVGREVGELATALQAQMRLARAGDLAAAQTVDEERVDPAFLVLDDRVEDAADFYEAEAERFAAISDIGLWLAVAIGCASIGGLSWRYERARRRSRAALAHSRARFRTLAQSAFEGVAVVSAGRVVEASDAFTTILGYRADEATTLSVVDLVAPEAQEQLRRSVSGDTHAEFEADGRRGDGTTVRLEIRTRPGWFAGQPVHTVAVRDVTERKALEEQLQHQALHDGLTGLANRSLFTDRLDHALVRSRREDAGSVAVLFFDLDDFKVVNDSLGHAAGDQLLRAVAVRMTTALRPEDTVARFGGDEFAVLLEDVDDEVEAVAAAHRILENFRSAPVSLPDGAQGFPVASIGIALGSPGVHDVESVLRDADLAMYEAKAQGKGRYAVFRPGMELHARDRMRLENDLRRAVERGELEVYYQPQVDMGSGRIRSVEALLRWNHPERGQVPPAEFIPVAEQSGQIIAIGGWVLRQACTQTSRWQRTHPSAAGLTVSVNVSAHQLNHPHLVDDVAAVLRDTGLSAGQLTLEVTESALLIDSPTVGAALAGLRQLGVRLAIDDFGTGYSSLSYLKRLYSDYLKIDKSFVDELVHNDDDQNIVASIVTLARTLGITCVAEGVEDAGQRDHLRSLGCELGQGYYFHRPTPPAALDEVFARPPAAAPTPQPSQGTGPAQDSDPPAGRIGDVDDLHGSPTS